MCTAEAVAFIAGELGESEDTTKAMLHNLSIRIKAVDDQCGRNFDKHEYGYEGAEPKTINLNWQKSKTEEE